MRLRAPIGCLAEVTGLNTRMGVNTPHGSELRAHRLRELSNFILAYAEFRVCSRNGENLDVKTHLATSRGPARALSCSRSATCAANPAMLALCASLASGTLMPRSALMRFCTSIAIRESTPRLISD